MIHLDRIAEFDGHAVYPTSADGGAQREPKYRFLNVDAATYALERLGIPADSWEHVEVDACAFVSALFEWLHLQGQSPTR